ncbi:MAG: AraC family transcriptional regulator [Saccharospirillaceae bacterium]|nr:AraC family transcriptional regulator [Saccharospirillaceae bacterium]MCD8533154.1 AraC family transcriptional regulator [Saccharospirillaceae bacterium]
MSSTIVYATAPLATTSSAWVRLLLQGAERFGLSSTALCEQAGIDAGVLQQPQGRIPQTQVTALWSAISAACPDDDLALTIGRDIRLEHAPVISFAMQSSRTLREALERLLRFHRLIGEAIDLPLQETAQGVRIRFHARQPVPLLSLHTAMVALVAMARWLTRQPVRPLTVTLRRSPPAHPEHWQQYFACPVQFSASQNSIEFSHELLAIAVAGANPQQAAAQDLAARHALQQLNEQQALAHVRYWIEQSLLLGEPDRAWVAGCLGLSISTLQRRLRAHGVTFKQLLEDVRREQALQLLQQGVALPEIALRLGYQEQSNFQRAFKRWFDQTPGRVRNERRENN